MNALTAVLATYLSLVGAGLIVVGANVLRRSLRLLLRGSRVRGTVMGWVEKPPLVDKEDAPTDHPCVRYHHACGRLIDFTSEFSGSPRRWPVGTLLTVTVAGDGPRDAELARPLMLLAGPAAMFLMGGLALYAGLDGLGYV